MSKSYFEIIRPGINSTFQDLGRFNQHHIGIPLSGVMDKRNYLIGNKLVGNSSNIPAIEFAYQGPILKIKSAKVIAAITGNVTFKIIRANSNIENGKCYETFELNDGDQVDIMTSDNVKPTVNWLDFVVTSKAKSKIKSSLNIEKKKISIEGKQILRRKLKQFKIKLDDKILSYMIKFFKINASNDLYYNVGIGKIDNKQIKSFVSDYNSSFIGFIRRRIGSNNKKVDKINESDHSIKFDKLIFGKDQELLKYSMANCCNPIPGDPVFGFVSVNDGIKVHKKDCPNSISLRSNYAYRVISAKWINSQSHEFNTKISLTGIDDIGIISQIASTISDSMNVNMNKLSFESNDGVFVGNISLEVKNKVILNKLLNSLKKIDGIEKVSRN